MTILKNLNIVKNFQKIHDNLNIKILPVTPSKFNYFKNIYLQFFVKLITFNNVNEEF